MGLVNQRRFWVATEESLHSPEKRRLTREKPLKIHVKKKKKICT